MIFCVAHVLENFVLYEDIEVISIERISDTSAAIVTLRRAPSFFPSPRALLPDVGSTASEDAVYHISIYDKPAWWAFWSVPWTPRTFTPLLTAGRRESGAIRILVHDLNSTGYGVRDGVPRYTLGVLRKVSIPKHNGTVCLLAGGVEGLAPALQVLRSLLDNCQEGNAPTIGVTWHTASWDRENKALLWERKSGRKILACWTCSRNKNWRPYRQHIPILCSSSTIRIR